MLVDGVPQVGLDPTRRAKEQVPVGEPEPKRRGGHDNQKDGVALQVGEGRGTVEVAQ